MKKALSLILALALLLALTVPAFAFSVERSAQMLVVDGKPVECDKYNIDGSNYFKLRDLAKLLDGTPAAFNVGWDADAGVVSITTGEAYTTANGTELVIGPDQSATARPSSATIKINGEIRSDLSAYNIGGNNYFKLRDLGTALGFEVGYDAEHNAATVRSGVPLARDVSLDRGTLALKVGETAVLTATVHPFGSTAVWSSSDEHVATVDQNGLVTAVAPGSADVTATQIDPSGNLSATCKVTVTRSLPTNFTCVRSEQKLIVDGELINCDKYNIDGSNYFKLRDLAKVLDGTNAQFDVGFDASAGVVSITTAHAYTTANGTELVIGRDQSATAQPSGQVIRIDGEDRYDLSAYNIGGSNFFKLRELGDALGFEVGFDAANNAATVTTAEPSITLDQTEVELGLYNFVDLVATTVPARATVTWTSSNESVAWVNPFGRVTSAGEYGTAVITASIGKASATCVVTVKEPDVTLRIEPYALYIAVGETYALQAVVTPADEPVTWTIGDESVATIDANGVVTAVGEGRTAVTAYAGDVEAWCYLTVMPYRTKITAPETLTMEVGDVVNLNATAEPAAGISYNSSDPSVVTVDLNGTLTALRPGTAEIQMTAGNGEAYCTVTVTGEALSAYDFLKTLCLSLGEQQDGVWYYTYAVESYEGSEILFGLAYTPDADLLDAIAMINTPYQGMTVTQYSDLTFTSALIGVYDFYFAYEVEDAGIYADALASIQSAGFTAGSAVELFDVESSFEMDDEQLANLNQMASSGMQLILAGLDQGLLVPNGYQLADLGFADWSAV